MICASAVHVFTHKRSHVLPDLPERKTSVI